MTSPAAPPSPVVAVDAWVTYGDHVALRNATFQIPAGKLTAIIGPNGSGKSTLLKITSGLEELRRGTVTVLGGPPGTQQARVAHVMQATKVSDALPLTVTEVVRMGRYPVRGAFGRFHSDDHRAVGLAMERMDITDLANRQVRDLSGGQQQRAFVAQGLAQEADLLLLDEPITGLDLVSHQRIDQVIGEELDAGRTVALTTHDVATASAADHVLLLATHIVAAGVPADVLTEEHLSHAYGGRAFRTADGALVIGDPHVHGVQLSGHGGNPVAHEH